MVSVCTLKFFSTTFKIKSFYYYFITFYWISPFLIPHSLYAHMGLLCVYIGMLCAHTSFLCVYAGLSHCTFFHLMISLCLVSLPSGTVVKNPPANAGDPGDIGLIPGSGRAPEGGSSNPLQYSCLGNPVDRGAWWATVHGVERSQTQLRD